MESFGELCERIVRAVLAESGPWTESPRPPPSRLHLPLAATEIAPEPACEAEEEGRACHRLPGELCLEMCGDRLQEERPDVALDVPTFEAMRDAEDNPLDLCDLARSEEPGRRAPEVQRITSAQPSAAVGAYLASLANMEASCVSTFEALVEELSAHGAPPDLIDRARTAQAEERVHVVLVGRLAARNGATAGGVGRKRKPKTRSLSAFACRNAAEGCGTEAFHALTMAWAAHTARDLSMRSLAKHIAADEARHADLAIDVQSWASERLPPHKVARLREIRDTAIRNAAREATSALVETRLGVPNMALAERLAERLIEELSGG
ncbi:MAG: hypothetical protein U0441_14535 [Polyangiaceae bacterium]